MERYTNEQGIIIYEAYYKSNETYADNIIGMGKNVIENRRHRI